MVSMAFKNLFVFCPFFLVFSLLYPVCEAETASERETFDESLVIKPLPSGHVYSYFNFAIKRKLDLAEDRFKSFQHVRLFPRSLSDTIVKHNVQELHLSLTQGQWKHQKWGYPFVDAPAGAELWVWFDKNTEDASKSWAELTNALSGLFCASLNFIGKTNTIHPKWSLRPKGLADAAYAQNSSYLYYSSLPKESVCTENLTPWKKLLPCDAKGGLASLLNSIYLSSTSYFSLSTSFKPVCWNDDCSEIASEFVFSLSAIFDQPITQSGKQDWSLIKLFGSPLFRSCPVARSSKIYLDLPNSNETDYTLLVDPNMEIVDPIRGRKIVTYDAQINIPQPRGLNVGMNYKGEHIYWLIQSPVLHATRFITGYGVEEGGVQCQIYNHHLSKPVKIIYLEVIPWFLRVFLHTLKIDSNGRPLKPEHQVYVPGKDRLRPYHLEMVLTLPPNSMTTITFKFERAFLQWTEYPPDANHGFYVGSSIISSVIDTAHNFSYLPGTSISTTPGEYFVQLHTEILLVSLPTPDFSMPFNVICLACTVVALAFGPIHNITTKRAVLPSEKKEGFLSKIKKYFKKKTNKEENPKKDD